MPRDLENIYRFHPLDRFTFIQRIQIRLYGLLLYLLTRSIGMTIRFETADLERWKTFRDAGQPLILTYWHDRSITAAYRGRNTGLVVMSSSSFDSEYTARCIQRLGFGIVKGSSTRGAVGGLIGMIDLMKQGFSCAFTVDGPKGPRYKVKAGPILLAKKTGAPLVPLVMECKHFWTIGSWDRLQIPKPFTKAAVLVGDFIYVDETGKDDEIEAKRLDLQHALDGLVEEGLKWRKGQDIKWRKGQDKG